MTPTPQGLNSVLYFLNYVTDLSTDPALPERLLVQIRDQYEPEMSELMCSAIKWALENPDFDFKQQMPVNYTNEQIYSYLVKVDQLFEKQNIYAKFLKR